MSKRWYTLIIVGGTFLFISLLFSQGLLAGLSETFTDKLFLKKPTDPHIIIISIDNESLKAIGGWPLPREDLARVIYRLKEAKVIGIDVNFSEPSRFGTGDDLSLSEAIKNFPKKVVLPLELGIEDKVVTEPLDIFKKYASLGFVNAPLSNGVARFSRNSRGAYASFDSEIAKVANIKFNETDPFRIAYRGGEGSYLTFTFDDVMEERVPEEVFKDSIVLIGATAPDLHDVLQTPFGLMPGVEVHANILETLKAGRYFREMPDYLSYLLLLFITCAAFYGVRRLKSLGILAFVFLGAIILLYALSAYLFTLYILIPTLYFLLGLILSSAVAVTYEYLTESKEKRFIKKSFQYYLPEDVVSELMNDPKKLVLGGEARELTILFSDIRGFTTLSERMSPEELTEFLNEFLTTMSDIIMDHKGLVDKYIGDAIMSFWGAPKQDSAHAYHACLGARAMLHALQDINKKTMSKGFPPLAIGIGLNTGEAIVGNMGSNKRFNYTVIGDEVNLASRLEGLTKYYKVGCIVSEGTRAAAEKSKEGPELYFRPLDRVLVKGKKEPRRLYELLPQSLPRSLEAHYLEGLAHYEKGKWKDAIISFNEGLKENPDGASEVFLERSEKFLQSPPENWEGVYEFTVK